MKSWLVFVLALFAPVATPVHAQAPASPPAVAPPKLATIGRVEMARVTKALAGKWATLETDVPHPGSKPRAARHGEQTWRAAPGGQTLFEEVVTREANGPAYDTAMLWWDSLARRIRGVWCADINDEGCSGFEGVWEDDRLVLRGEWEHQGERRAWMETFEFKGRNAFTQTLAIGPVGGTLEPVTVIRAKRVPPRRRAS